MATIPFNKPCLVGRELDYMRQAMENAHTCGNGPFTKACCMFLQRAIGVPHALLTTSCTHALEMAALLLELKPGDEVILPSFTFVSTANAFVLRGARPIFCDIRQDTLNLDENELEALITARTRAIVVVHYAGIGCEMDGIMDIADRHNVAVIEDNAHGLFGKYKGKNLGTFGCLAAQSFHETKNLTCGEGGALLVNDTKYGERAEIILEKGTDRSRFFRGQIDKYTWVDVGSSYLPSDVLAAYLLAQLEAHDHIQTKRRHIWDYYWTNLRSWADAHDVRFPVVPEDCEQAYHMFYLLIPSLHQRQEFMKQLRSREIVSAFHYLPLHVSLMAKQFGYQAGSCPITENVSDRLVRLPFYNDLSDGDLAQVAEAIHDCSL